MGRSVNCLFSSRPLIGYGTIQFWTVQFRHTGLGMDVGREKEGREKKENIIIETSQKGHPFPLSRRNEE